MCDGAESTSAIASAKGPDANALDLQECIGDLTAEIVVSANVCVIATASSPDAIQPQLKRDAPGMLKSATVLDLSRLDVASRMDMIRVRLNRFGWKCDVDMVRGVCGPRCVSQSSV